MSHGLRVEYTGIDKDLDQGIQRIAEEHCGELVNTGYFIPKGIRDLEFSFLYEELREITKERLEDTFCEENIGIKITITEFELETPDEE